MKAIGNDVLGQQFQNNTAVRMNRTYTEAQMESMRKQKAFAWAQIFEMHAGRVGDAGVMGTLFRRANGRLQRPAEFLPHLTLEMWEMANRLNETYTCPVCLDLTTTETFKLTTCGHIVCKSCFEYLEDHAPLNTRPKCPTCRRNI